MLKGHGGNLWEEAKRFRINPLRIKDFSSSINLPPTGSARLDWIKKGMKNIHRYPDPEYGELRAALARIYRLSPANIVPANGSTELLYMTPRAVRSRSALIVSPSYADYGDACRMAGVKVKRFFLRPADDFEADTEKLSAMARNFDTVIIGNPNNPTGTVIDRKLLLKLIDKNPRTMFVVDESFMDFVPEQSLLTALRKNLVIIRSLTKFYGIPGLRAGFAAMLPDTAKKLWSHKEPWSVNCLAESFIVNLAEAGFDNDKIIKSSASEIRYLYKKLSAMDGIKVFPSKANFLLARLRGQNATAGQARLSRKKHNGASLKAALLRKGILIRDCSNFVGLDRSYFRISARKRADNRILLDGLRKLLNAR